MKLYLMTIEFSKHALEQIERRCISKDLVLSIVNQPDSTIDQDKTVRIYSKLVKEKSKLYLYRVFVNLLKEPVLIVQFIKLQK